MTGIDVWRDGDIVTIRVSGEGFLYNMVRIIAGTLIQVGNGQYPPERVREILNACDRSVSGPTAPAHGLTLMGIEFLIHKNERSFTLICNDSDSSFPG